jgi:preprotein translocase subunit SecG
MHEMLALPFLHYVVAAIFIAICILLMLVILIQKGRGGGLSGAFGGVGGHSAFGAKTGDVFTWITVALAGCFLLVAVWMNYVFVRLPTGLAPATPPAGAPTGAPTGAPAGSPDSSAPSPTPGEAPAPAPAPSPATPETPAP